MFDPNALWVDICIGSVFPHSYLFDIMQRAVLCFWILLFSLCVTKLIDNKARSFTLNAISEAQCIRLLCDELAVFSLNIISLEYASQVFHFITLTTHQSIFAFLYLLCIIIFHEFNFPFCSKWLAVLYRVWTNPNPGDSELPGQFSQFVFILHCCVLLTRQ